jgi:hypothetical protein
MSNTNVLLCRICDRDHESRNALTSHMRLHHNACEMPYTCQLCKFRSSMYSDVVDHFKKVSIVNSLNFNRGRLGRDRTVVGYISDVVDHFKNVSIVNSLNFNQRP